MRKYQPYLIIALALLLIFWIPHRIQNALRLLVIKPILPFASLAKKIPNTTPPLSLYNGTPARVIYRNPISWNQSLWINLGDSMNQEKIIIQRFSPVLAKGVLIGIVDYIGAKQSRVKLITDAHCTLAVRVLREEGVDPTLLASFEQILSLEATQKNSPLYEELLCLRDHFSKEKGTGYYLAKGEIRGSGAPLWRSGNKILLGRGFNCETEDAWSPARNLFTGEPLQSELPPMPLVQKGDLLITSGLEGIFPPSLPIARVIEVEPVEEGAFYYSLKATPLTKKLDDIFYVEVLLPTDFHPEYTK